MRPHLPKIRRNMKCVVFYLTHRVQLHRRCSVYRGLVGRKIDSTVLRVLGKFSHIQALHRHKHSHTLTQAGAGASTGMVSHLTVSLINSWRVAIARQQQCVSVSESYASITACDLISPVDNVGAAGRRDWCVQNIDFVESPEQGRSQMGQGTMSPVECVELLWAMKMEITVVRQRKVFHRIFLSRGTQPLPSIQVTSSPHPVSCDLRLCDLPLSITRTMTMTFEPVTDVHSPQGALTPNICRHSLRTDVYCTYDTYRQQNARNWKTV